MDEIERRLEGCLSAGCLALAILFVVFVVASAVVEQLHLPLTPGLGILVVVVACLVFGTSSSGGKGKRAGRGAAPVEVGGAGEPPTSPARRRSSPWRDLQDLAECHTRGLISDAEFARARADLLGLPESQPDPRRRLRR